MLKKAFVLFFISLQILFAQESDKILQKKYGIVLSTHNGEYKDTIASLSMKNNIKIIWKNEYQMNIIQ